MCVCVCVCVCVCYQNKQLFADFKKYVLFYNRLETGLVIKCHIWTCRISPLYYLKWIID